MVGKRDGRAGGRADHSNPHSGRVAGGFFGQKGGFGPQRPDKVLGPLHNPEGDPFILRSFLKGKKGFGSNPGPSPNNPVMKGPSTSLKEGGPQTNPFQALRGQIEFPLSKSLKLRWREERSPSLRRKGRKQQ